MKRTIIVLAAGQGTRMKSPRAKVLHPLLGRPMLAHLLEALSSLRADRIIVVVGHQAEQTTPIAQGFGATTVLQEPQLGTGHALMCCREVLGGEEPSSALLVAGDVPLLPVDQVESYWEAFQSSAAAAAVATLTLDEPSGYGRILRDGRGQLQAIVEERDATEDQRAIREVNSGVYFLRLPSMLALLDGLGTANAQKEYYLTDLVALLHGKGTPAVSFQAVDPELWLGINSQAELARATGRLRLDIVRRWMDQGVTVMDPSTTWIEPGVRLASGVVLHPSVRLCGDTRMESGCEVRSFSTLVGVHLGEGTLVKENCVLEGTLTGAGCIIGPLCRTREGTLLEERVHLGNFVETKKARLGAGVKANHLTYLGDATVGAGSNIGAGTITCNYDGVHKHPTVLGNRVFVGSDTQLVAPVTVGDGAYIGAGTTVTKNVPAGALAISRAPQKNLEGWADRRNKKG
jgi:bifunctional UDP-N-acetylglucosamine pyrophosphorylase/glucosamine-1-phosphate N-acetyltransferase